MKARRSQVVPSHRTSSVHRPYRTRFIAVLLEQTGERGGTARLSTVLFSLSILLLVPASTLDMNDAALAVASG